MSLVVKLKEAVGDFRSPSVNPLGGKSLIVEAGSVEARLSALEHDVANLRDGLYIAAEEVDDLASRVITTE